MRNRSILLSFGFVALTGSAMAAIPDGAAPSDKPPLYHAAPAINDPGTTIRGTRPVGTKPSDPTEDYLQAQGPGPAKPPLYRASPMIYDPVAPTIVRGKVPVSNGPLIHATAPEPPAQQ